MINKKDVKILDILKRNAKLTNEEISKKTGIPTTTIHNRIKRLERLGVIKNYTVVLDNKKLGKEISAYILITVDYKFLKKRGISQHDLARNLKKYDFVEEVSMITGVSDIIIKTSVENIDQLDELVTKELRNIDGIEKTQTMIVLSSF
jgi:DNA-binding Lrp family transcriptional regulator